MTTKKIKYFIRRAYNNNKYVQSLLDQLPCDLDESMNADHTAVDLKYAMKELDKISKK